MLQNLFTIVLTMLGLMSLRSFTVLKMSIVPSASIWSIAFTIANKTPVSPQPFLQNIIYNFFQLTLNTFYLHCTSSFDSLDIRWLNLISNTSFKICCAVGVFEMHNLSCVITYSSWIRRYFLFMVFICICIIIQ